jgi:hypothetical protein
MADDTPTRDQFLQALDDDLNAPRALGLLRLARHRAGDDPPQTAWIEEGEEILGLAGL